MGESVGICVPGGLSSLDAKKYLLKHMCKITLSTDPTDSANATKADATLAKMDFGIGEKKPDDHVSGKLFGRAMQELDKCGWFTNDQIIPFDPAVCIEAQKALGGTIAPEPKGTDVVIKVKRGEQSVDFAKQLKIPSDHKGSLFIKVDDTNVCPSLSTSGSGDNRQVNIGRQVNAGTTFDIIVELKDGDELLESYKAKIQVVEDDKQGKKGGKTGEKKPAGPRPIAGKCGLNAKEFSAETHTLSGRGMCAAGKSEPKTVSFSGTDLTVRWQCLGKNGGADDDCAATRKAPAARPVVAEPARTAPEPARTEPAPASAPAEKLCNTAQIMRGGMEGHDPASENCKVVGGKVTWIAK